MFCWHVRVAGRVSFGVDSNTIYIGKCTTATVNNGNWRHIVGVFNGVAGAVTAGQFAIYIDGVAAATANITVSAVAAPLSG
ncbi:MAG: LamG-like jellyroll fold domain-containing protein [Pseudobdellovibrio sp.]